MLSWQAIWLTAVLTLLALSWAGWGALALWYALPWPPPARALPVATWLLAALAGVAGLWHPGLRPALIVFAVASAALLLWWASLRPSHDRVWADDVARLLRPHVEDGRVVLHNVRNFRWRSRTDYDIRWETREYDLSALRSIDLILSYWTGPHIAHTLVSFGFEDGRYLTFSLEIRRERGEQYTPVGGFFRRFEQVLVAADERDIVHLRTNVRHERTRLYRLNLSRPAIRALFLAFVEEAAALARRPRFYNTLTSNCTTVAFNLARGLSPGLPLDYRVLLSGHLAEYAHDQGALTPGYDYATLRERGYISERARHAGDGEDYSRVIRRGVPGVGTGVD